MTKFFMQEFEIAMAQALACAKMLDSYRSDDEPEAFYAARTLALTALRKLHFLVEEKR